jgi:hypothetical protein
LRQFTGSSTRNAPHVVHHAARSDFGCGDFSRVVCYYLRGTLFFEAPRSKSCYRIVHGVDGAGPQFAPLVSLQRPNDCSAGSNVSICERGWSGFIGRRYIFDDRRAKTFARRSVSYGIPSEGDWSDRDGNGQHLRYFPIGKRRLTNVERANARRKSWLAILANFLEAHCALGLFFKRKSQIHRGLGVTSVGLAVTA